MRYKKFAFTVVISLIFLWNCSSHQKPPKITRETSPSPEKSPTQNKDQEKPPTAPKKNSEKKPTSPKKEKNPPESKDPEKLLEEALYVYQDAKVAWEESDIDTALAALDEAYSLILKLDLPQDSPLNKEKNDLRLLIARRIQEIYASRLTAVGENHGSIPIVENKYVKQEIKIFQTREKKYFKAAYKRSGRYRPMICDKLRKAGLPQEFSWIPLIESFFKVKAYSRARALGLWQFIASTGYRYGLKRNQWIDERMDPEKATEAAIKYFKELHSMFGDWTTALAAYNCGEMRVQRVIRAQRIKYLDNFWDLFTMLPRETARFVPRFIATLCIVKNPEKYNFNLPKPAPPLKYETVKINRPVKLSSLSRALGLPKDKLSSLNPELRHNATPKNEYLLKVPPDYGRKTLAKIDSLPRWVPPEASYFIYYVKKGDTVSEIADRYGTSISSIARLNHLHGNYLIRPGQKLKVPGNKKRSSRYSRSLSLNKDKDKLVYVVQKGDSLYRIARDFKTTVQKIKNQNNLDSNILRIGQKLVIQSGKPQGASVYTVKRGDTPFDISREFGMSLNTFLSINGLSTRSKIYPGQQLWVISPNNEDE
ncbi:LysM peptidoglycan-binding domain-containing protein [bacterium]|nr:LysM peptidoglycan-binding domain-containing protein [bacterium]